MTLREIWVYVTESDDVDEWWNGDEEAGDG